MIMTFYNWDALYERAMGQPFNSRELNAKDNARAYFEEHYKLNTNVGPADICVEEQIDDVIRDEDKEPVFDIDGNFVAEVNTHGMEWRYK